MDTKKHYIAVDLGAESGRIMLGELYEKRLSLNEIYRFSNEPIKESGSLRWNFNTLIAEVKQGIGMAVHQAEGKVSGIGVDSWGVDFGLLDRDGQLIENPYHYRDSRTDGILEQAFEIMPQEEIFRHSGLQFMKLNTLYQLLALKQYHPDVIAGAYRLLFMADLISYFLTGESYAEYTLASTSQLMDMNRGVWSNIILEKFGLSRGIMPKIVPPGTIIASLQDSVCEELGVESIPVIAVGSHDTADAVAAAPAAGDHWAYISSGTWSLVGVETDRALINGEVLRHSFTNEGGVNGTIRLLKNLMGLWPLQECRKQWKSKGEDLTYSTLTKLVGDAESFIGYLDMDYEGLFSPGDMPAKINEYLVKTGQAKINNKGQMTRVILEGLALKYRAAIEALEQILKKNIDVIHIVGGGSRNVWLSRFAANATGKTIVTGPVEATAMGNILMQAIATAQITSISEGREIVRRSVELKTYQPADRESWSRHYRKWINV